MLFSYQFPMAIKSLAKLLMIVMIASCGKFATKNGDVASSEQQENSEENEKEETVTPTPTEDVPLPTAANPQSFSVTSTTPSEINLQWTAASEKHDGHRIVYQEGSAAPESCSGAGIAISESQIGSASILKVSGLSASKTYTFRLCTLLKVARFEGEVSVYSVGLTTSGATLDLPPGEVSNLTVVQNSSNVTLSWNGPDQVDFRIVWAMNTDQPPAQKCTGAYKFVTNAKNFSIKELELNRYHSFRVCSANKNPNPDVSLGATATVFMSSGIPPNPTGLVLSTPSATSLRVRFNSGGGSTAKFKIAYKSGAVVPSNCADGSVYTTSGTASSMDVTLSSLTPNPNPIYGVRVCAINSDIFPSESSGITGTARPVPEISTPFCTDDGAPVIKWTTATGKHYFSVRDEGAPQATSCYDNGFLTTETEIRSSGNTQYGGALNGPSKIVWICSYDSANGNLYSTGKKILVTMPKSINGQLFPGSCTNLSN